MESLERQVILPPPPSVSLALTALVYAALVRFAAFVSKTINRLRHPPRRPAAVPARVSGFVNTQAWRPLQVATMGCMPDAAPTFSERVTQRSSTSRRRSAATAIDRLRMG